jgi:hypothetical protein
MDHQERMLLEVTIMNMHMGAIFVMLNDKRKLQLVCRQCKCVIIDFDAVTVPLDDLLSAIQVHVWNRVGVPE